MKYQAKHNIYHSMLGFVSPTKPLYGNTQDIGKLSLAIIYQALIMIHSSAIYLTVWQSLSALDSLEKLMWMYDSINFNSKKKPISHTHTHTHLPFFGQVCSYKFYNILNLPVPRIKTTVAAGAATSGQNATKRAIRSGVNFLSG